MTSIQERIQAAFLAALLNTTSAGANVSRSRETFLDRASTQAIGIFPGAETDKPASDRADQHDFVVNVDVFGRGDPWYPVADEVVTAAHRLLMTDAALKELITRIRRISRHATDDDADLTAGTYQMEYEVRYLSKSSDISDSNTF